MSGMIKTIVFVFTALFISGGSAFGGWFSFEPNLILLDGTAVARYLEDIEQETAYLAKGDESHANQLISDEKVYRIKAGKDLTRVVYLDYEEHEDLIFIHVQDETGTKVWANMNGLACLDASGKEKQITKQDVVKGEFQPLP